MKSDHVNAEDLEWQCYQCRRPLVVKPIAVSYMGNRFNAELPQCPQCGFVFVSEEIAMGKMAEVERILEDK
jgi:hypothetical protein